MGAFNCGTFVAGIVKVMNYLIFWFPLTSLSLSLILILILVYWLPFVCFLLNLISFTVQGVLDGAGFPARVTAHFVAVEGQARPRTTILIKFAEEVCFLQSSWFQNPNLNTRLIQDDEPTQINAVVNFLIICSSWIPKSKWRISFFLMDHISPTNYVDYRA